ncbi:uncharacterized protein BX664DRAFT_335691 [Halteromyces radiatus]|uniref:uncharacterized protein n=1 Tax=Halteromyces radiatus TaxID=101107 RepID=UPI00221FC0A0|nr:uncharacterized protein BX664DRAFT_335691 [Halteromyces radiatus]KAI8086397.1 hypothetical protein BX664DRAFT_335691 [Halteromyces radiatus]
MGGIFNTGRPQFKGRGRGMSTQRPGMAQYQQQQQQQQQQQAIPYNDFQLLSCARGGSKTNLIDFKDAHNNINMADFSRPVKLHRKESSYAYYQRMQRQGFRNYGNDSLNNNNNNNNNNHSTAATSTSTLSTDNADASTLTKTDTNGTSTPNTTNNTQQRYEKYQQGPKTGADTSLIAPMGGATRNKQMLFKKRTRQIYLAKEDTRELKEQEHRPWILEDFTGTNSFTGTLEGGQRSDYVLFVLTENGFKVVPLDRWYKFQRKRHIRTLTADEVEEQLKKERKQAKHDSNRWMMLKRDEEDLGDRSSSPKSRLKIVDTGESRRATSDDEGGGKRHDSDIDDLDFDDVFQDDEEGGNDHEMEDEDIKDGKERIKKEHKGFAPQQEDGDDEQNHFEESKLTFEGKQMRKLVRDLEKNRAYESDEDKDPYATSEEELESDLDDEEEGSDKEGKDKEKQQQQQQQQQQQLEDGIKSTTTLKKKTPVAKPGMRKTIKKKEGLSRPIGRPGSPSVKRETSPPRSLSSGRSGSTSPMESSPSPPGSTEIGVVGKKRKVDDHEHRTGKQHRVTSPRHSSPASNHPDDASLITEEEVVETLRGRTMSTKDFLMRFRKRIKKNERNRDVITTLLKRVARHNVTSDPSVKMLELKPELA